MEDQLSKPELIQLVERLMSGQWNEDEMKLLFGEIAQNVPCPRTEIQGYIFHAADNPTAQIIVERMLAYKKINT